VRAAWYGAGKASFMSAAEPASRMAPMARAITKLLARQKRDVQMAVIAGRRPSCSVGSGGMSG
jgi:hypothetical protein